MSSRFQSSFLFLMVAASPAFMAGSTYAQDIDALIRQVEINSQRGGDETAKASAMNQLMAIGEPAVEKIAAKLNAGSSSIQTQWSMAYLLGKSKSANAIQPLLQNLQRTDNSFQRNVISSAFKSIGQPAAHALVEYSNRQASVARAGNMAAWAPEWLAIAAVGRALGDLNDARAVAPLKTLLQAHFEITAKAGAGTWGASSSIKRDLITALVKLASPEVAPLLEEMAARDPDVAQFAGEALQKLAIAQVGRNPFEIIEPIRPLSDQRVYNITYAQEVFYTDVESGEVISAKVIPAGARTSR